MRRRDFFKLTSTAGLAVLTPWGHQAMAAAEMRGFPGPYWITINLRGGWDTTMFCEPRGRDHVVDGARALGMPTNGVNRHFASDEIDASRAPFRCAPDMSDSRDWYMTAASGEHIADTLTTPGFTIINGVDAGLTAHAQAERLAMSGSITKGTPTLAALVAADRVHNGQLGPMPMVTFGGYDATGDLVAPTRLTRLEVLSKVTKPNLSLPNQIGDNHRRFHRVEAASLIDAAVQRRLLAKRATARLPGRRKGLDALYTARLNQADVRRFSEAFSEADFNTANTSIKRQIYTALTAFATNTAASAAMVINGWDSHGTNDVQQRRRFRELFGGLRFLKSWADTLDLTPRLNVVITSEFSRTPFYNSAGKDHHAVSSWMTMLWAHRAANGLGAGIRVVGGTDDNILARRLHSDLSTAGDEDAPGSPQGEADAGGVAVAVKLNPTIMHNELRKVAGIHDSPVVAPFALQESAMPIWG